MTGFGVICECPAGKGESAKLADDATGWFGLEMLIPMRNVNAPRGLQQRWKEDEMKLTLLRRQIKAGIDALDGGAFTGIDEADLDATLNRLADSR